MKQVGIWLDKRATQIISITDAEKEASKLIISKIEEFKVRGGSGTRFKGGPQHVVHDSKYLEREVHQTRIYFQNIVAGLNEPEEIVIFGPAEMPRKLFKFLRVNYPKLASKVMGVATEDSMTKGKMKAWVRKYFSKTNVRLRGW